MKPIWKDTALTLSASTNYTITSGGKTLFSGRCDMQPDGTCEILTNKACQYWLKQDFPTSTGVTLHPDACKRFKISGENQVNIATEDFLMDWSYEDVEYGHNILSNPVNGVLDPRMRAMFSTFNQTPYIANFLTDLVITFGVDFPLYVDFRGGTTYVPFTANTEFYVTTSGNWINAEIDGSNIVITTQQNEGTVRNGSICLHWTDGKGVRRTQCYDVIEGGQDEPLDNQIWYFTDPSDYYSKYQFRIVTGSPDELITAYRYGDDGLWIATANRPITHVVNAVGPDNHHLTKLVFPRSVVYAGSTLSNGSFFRNTQPCTGVSVDEIQFLSDSALTIGGFNTKGAVNVVLPEGVPTAIEPFAFHYCGKTSINLNSGVTSIGEDALSKYADTALTLDWPVAVKGHAFDGSGIKYLRIGSGVTFDYTGWDIPDVETGSVQPYGSPFHNTKLQTVVLDEGVARIPRELFYNQSGATFSLPSTLTYIGEDAFNGCHVPSTITLGDGAEIEYNAFRYSSGLTQINADGDISIYYNALWSVSSGITGISATGYVTIGGSNQMPNIKTLTAGGTLSAGERTFSNATGITTFSASKVTGGLEAFRNSSIYGALTLTGELGNYAFAGCTGVTAITIDTGCTNLGNRVFESITITDITYLGTQAQWNAIPKGNYSWVIGSSIRYVHCTDGTIDLGGHA